eukprot:UN29077
MVDIHEVVKTQDRIRGRTNIDGQEGWISLYNIENGSEWVKQVSRTPSREKIITPDVAWSRICSPRNRSSRISKLKQKLEIINNQTINNKQRSDNSVSPKNRDHLFDFNRANIYSQWRRDPIGLRRSRDQITPDSISTESDIQF